jgi:hypothetical protein
VSASQLPLLATADGDAELLRLFRAVVDRVGLKMAAGDLDVAPSQLAHCIAARQHHHVRAEWLSWAVRQVGGEEIARHLAGLAGFDLVPAAPLEPAAVLDSMRRLVGPEVFALAVADARANRGK